MMPKGRKINYLSLYSPSARISQPPFFFFLILFLFVLSFLSDNLLVHLIGVSRSVTHKEKEREGERNEKEKSRIGKERDRHKQIELDRDKASVCHAQKKVLGRQTAGAKP